MTIALGWKEWRDHRAIWFTLALAIIGGLALFVALVDPPGHVRPNSDKAVLALGLAYILGVTYGLVCGAMMLAGEVEAGTQAYLDMHAGSRAEIWRGKFTAGVLLTVAQGLVALATLTVIFEPATSDPGHFLIMNVGLTLAALEAFCWGMFFSARQQTVLAAAAATAVALILVWLFSLMLLTQQSAIGLFLRLPLALVVLYASRRRYCQDDRQRVSEEGSAISPQRVLLWLAWQQGKGTIAWVVLCSLLVGTAMGYHVPGWPLLLLALSVLCGVQVFADEQTSQSQRFLATQRLPAERVWLIKTGFWGGITALTSGLPYLITVLIDSFQVVPSTTSRSTAWFGGSPDLLARLGDDALRELVGPGLFAVLIPLYGFSVAQYFGLYVRKPIGSIVVSYLVAAAGLAFWLPSLVCGGVGVWQVLIPPTLLFTGTRLAVWPWLRDELGQPRALLRFWTPGVAALATIAGSLVWRVEEIKPGAINLRAFEDRLLPPEKNEAGRLYRKAREEFMARLQQVENEIGPPPQPSMGMGMPGAGGAAPGGAMGGPPTIIPSPPGGEAPGAVPVPHAPPAPPGLPAPAIPAEAAAGIGAPPGPGADPAEGGAAGAMGMGSESTPTQTWLEVMTHLPQEGWPKEPGNLPKVLDQLYAGDWARTLREAAALPDGMIEDPRTLTWFSPLPYVQTYREVSFVQTARALQLQAAGDHAGALERHLEVLPLSRALGHDAVGVSYLAGLAIEAQTLSQLELWLEKAKDQPKLLRRALQALREHEARKPSPTEYVMVEYLILQRTFEDPHAFFRSSTAPWVSQSLMREMAELLYAARQVPWEKERWDRLLSAWTAQQLEKASQKQQGLPTSTALPMGFWDDHFVQYFLGSMKLSPAVDVPSFSQVSDRYRRQLHDLQLKIAKDLYRLEKKQAPKSIQDLVPDYLPESFLQKGQQVTFASEAEDVP